MKIIIPTYMRETNQKCYNALPDDIKKLVTLVTHSGRAEALASENTTADVIDIGITNGIADVRSKLVSIFGSDNDKLMIIDDSCTFKKRDENMKLVNMTSQDYLDMFSAVETALDEYPMVGISDQGGNNRVTENIKEIGRAYSCYGINAKFLLDRGINFDGMYKVDPEIKLYEDFYLILKLLTSGYKNAIIYSYAFSHPHGKAGGNSTIRTNDLQKKCLLALQREFPGLVVLVKKEDPSWKAGLDDMDDFRWEAKISWQEAYKRGLDGDQQSLVDFFG